MKPLTKIEKKTLKDLDKLIKIINEADRLVHELLSERAYDRLAANHYANSQDLAVSSFLKIACGEPQHIWDFVDEFGTPGSPEGKAVCWNGSYPPENIQSLIAYGDMSTSEKIKEVRKLYKVCIKAREDFNALHKTKR